MQFRLLPFTTSLHLRDGNWPFRYVLLADLQFFSSCASHLDLQRLLRSISPRHGRALIYVWAIEQDNLSKRTIPTNSPEECSDDPPTGQDVFVPWVLAQQTPPKPKSKGRRKLQDDGSQEQPPDAGQSKVFNRYYHMFAKGELRELVCEAAAELGLHVGSERAADSRPHRGVEIVQDGWERSNYYVELKCWEGK